jgi:dolichol kinase
VPIQFHLGGRWRRWLGARLGGDEELGERAWRRILHFLGAGVLLYDVLPPRFFIVLPTEAVLLLALAAILILEALRLLAAAELPTIREYERNRPASYAYYAVALVVVILLFPLPVAAVAVLGAAFVDPLIGELRRTPGRSRYYPAVPILVYLAFAVPALLVLGRLSWLAALGMGAVAAAVALVVERPRVWGLDDDLAMTLAPALVLEALRYAAPSFFG